MKHDELLKKIDDNWIGTIANSDLARALLAVVELHNDELGILCTYCDREYPCPTIEAIEKELA